MHADEYKTISGESSGLYKEKGSKFLSFAYPVSQEEQVKDILFDLRKKYHDARHHCYAYSIGSDRESYRYNDDGEPSGTGGKPIFGQLLSHEITEVLIVVIRYFGGTKLGVSGLINAYRQAAKEAIESGNIIVQTVQKSIRVDFEYAQMNDVMRIVKEMNPEVIQQNFDLSCSMALSIRLKDYDELCGKCEKIVGVTITEGAFGL